MCFPDFFWNKYEFTTREQIDQELNWFNQSSLRYTVYERPVEKQPGNRSDFKPEVMFIRHVRDKVWCWNN